jgi:phenylpyruvate tautomerase PptA (4-oxalocrotonate tautomerase family)
MIVTLRHTRRRFPAHRGKVLFRDLCTGGGILAPALTVIDPTLPNLLLAGSWRVNVAVQEAEERARQRLPEAVALLRNHDLRLLMAAALELALDSAANGRKDKDQRELIGKLAAAVPGYFHTLGETVPGALAQDNLPNIAVRFALAPETAPAASDRATWGALLDDLARRAADPPHGKVLTLGLAATQSTSLPAAIKAELAAHLDRTFDQFVIEIFKQDATGRGPAGGRGWAALTLLFWGKLLSDVKSLRAGHAELRDSLLDAEKRLSGKLDELVRWHGPFAFEQGDGLAPWLHSLHDNLAAKLDEISGLVGHGLLSPEEFRFAYWNKRRSDPGLEQLWEDAGRAEILTQSLVGRAPELADFEKFLGSSAPWVQFWKGWPGTGKSRLMIEFAARATAMGCRVFFVSPDVHDLKAALLRVNSAEPLVLLWDDYQGDKPNALRTFLELQRPPANPSGPVVKRAITAWPTLNLLGEKARDPLYAERELHAIVPPDELVVYTRRLLPSAGPDGAEQIVRIAEAHLEAVLRAAALLLQGTAIDQLPRNLLEAAYDDLIKRLMQGRALPEKQAVKDALLALALVGSVDLGNQDHRHALEAAGIADEALDVLVDLRTTSRDREVCSLALDSFRAHVVRRSLDHQRIDVLSGTPQELARFARPLLIEWFDAIWAICVLATEGNPHRDSIQTGLLAAFDDVSPEWTAEQAAEAARRIVNATVAERDPRQREALANRIGELLARHDNPGIALWQAKALSNATAGERAPRRCKALADRIGELLSRHDMPDIALAQARALFNATVVEPDPQQCEALSDRIGELLARHHSPEIALRQAEALNNATAVEPDAQQCEALAARIGELLARHDMPEIALAQAKALANATAIQPDARQREALANRIGEVLARHANPVIALEQAKALANATAVQPDPRQREALANRIGELLARHDTPDIALEQAKALVNATAGEPNPRQREALADHIGELLARHDTFDIALEQAKALANASVIERDPLQCEALADRIGKLLARHDTPDIALEQAKALVNATAGEPNPRQREALADRIGELLARHDTPEIAIRQAKALYYATLVEPDPRQREALVARISELEARYGFQLVARP